MTPYFLVTSIAAATYFYKGASENSALYIEMSEYFAWSTCSFSVATNLWATGLIFIQTWCVVSLIPL